MRFRGQYSYKFIVYGSKLQAKGYEFRLRVHSEEFNVTSLSSEFQAK